MLAGDEARMLGAALAAVAEQEGRGELADIRARLRERRQAAWGEGGEGRRTGQMSSFRDASIITFALLQKLKYYANYAYFS
jgi:hypothetical protein